MTSLIRIHRALGLAALFVAVALPSFAQSMGTSGGHDLDQLWTQAQKQFDTSKHDAVVLLESRHVTVLDNGDLRTRIHRVVWIGTKVGISSHADLRIPYNAGTSTLEVSVLRTWRDNIWWPRSGAVSPSATVETLPFALSRADDYTPMRETMLLHDGVEIPCIMETVYEIEERAGAAGGIDGLWVFAQRDPAVWVELVLTNPGGNSVLYRAGNGAPEPSTQGSTTHTWKMENVERLGSPAVADPASYAPYLAWTTWPDWQTVGQKINTSFNKAAVLSDALADTLAKRLDQFPTPASRASAIARYIDETTRSIHYDPSFWSFAPRAATRTWETAYGHGLDRAVLAAALFREAGLKAGPVYRSAGTSGIDQEVPGMSRFGEIAVWVSGDDMNAFYNPATGTLTDGPRPFQGRVIWTPGTPPSRPEHDSADAISKFDLTLTLQPNEDGGWGGTGFLGADGYLCPYDEMVGLGGDAEKRLDLISGSALHGAEVERYNPEVFEPGRVSVGFAVNAKAADPDKRGRERIVLGSPAGGIMAQLPSDVHLYHERRSSPILLPAAMTQRVSLRLKTGEREIVYLPEPKTVENEAGRYELTVENSDGWVIIRRELTLATRTITPQAWPSLRALLLDETDTANRTILMK